MLSIDRVWNCFALADLVEPFRSSTRIGLAHGASGGEAAILVLDQPDLHVVSPWGLDEGVAALLDALVPVLPQEAFLQARREHRPLLERHYRPQGPWQELYRMSVGQDAFRPAGSPPGLTVTRLGPEDNAELKSFYGPMAPGPFPDEQLLHGVFFGVRQGDRFASVAGTHAVAPAHGVAVVGGVKTDPDFLRRGLALAVTSRLTEELLEMGCRDVSLNVVTTNSGAVRLYERLGYRTRHTFFSCLAARHGDDQLVQGHNLGR